MLGAQALRTKQKNEKMAANRRSKHELGALETTAMRCGGNRKANGCSLGVSDGGMDMRRSKSTAGITASHSTTPLCLQKQLSANNHGSSSPSQKKFSTPTTSQSSHALSPKSSASMVFSPSPLSEEAGGTGSPPMPDRGHRSSSGNDPGNLTLTPPLQGKSPAKRTNSRSKFISFFSSKKNNEKSTASSNQQD